MISKIEKIFTEANVLFHYNQSILVCTCPDIRSGLSLAKTLLYAIVDRKTVLYLSGGSTPKALYEQLAQDEMLTPAAVGMVDERYGKKFHASSNETMFKETGLLRYFEMLDIPFYPIIKTEMSLIDASGAYDKAYRRLNSIFTRHVGILGVGADGHISSIIPNRSDFKNPMFDRNRKDLLISEFSDPNSPYGKRIGMTFLGLSMLDLEIVLVFGDEKRNALTYLFEEGSEELIPARFFKRGDIAKKTLFITDQTI